ncbi:hypothetical protein ACHWQZ_G006520 [Mnemiopsis leidyi]
MVDLEFENEDRSKYSIKSDAVRFTWAGYMIFVLISSLLGDSVILVGSVKYRAIRLHKIIVVTIQHIAVCDLLLSCTCALPKLVSLLTNRWVFGNYLCFMLFRPMEYYLNAASLLLICCMTCSKLAILKYPLRKITLRVAHWTCSTCWFTALIIPAVASFVGGSADDVYFSYKSYTCTADYSSEVWPWMLPLMAVTFILLPICLVIGITICLLVIANKVALRNRGCVRWQGVMTTILIATVYCISLVPYAIYCVAKFRFSCENGENSFFHSHFLRLAISFIYFNTMSNFYVYCLTVASFRVFLRERFHVFHQFCTGRSGKVSGEGKEKEATVKQNRSKSPDRKKRNAIYPISSV